LYAPAELDVVSVFTAGDDRVATLHTERVPFRRVTEVPELCADLDLSINTGSTPWRVVVDPGNPNVPRPASILSPIVGGSPTDPPFPPLTGASWVGPFQRGHRPGQDW
jgi:hypothetical protein